jgi:hypothetical protein
MSYNLGSSVFTKKLVAEQIGDANNKVNDFYVDNLDVGLVKVVDNLEFENQISLIQPNDNRIRIGNLALDPTQPNDSIVIGNQGEVGPESVSVGSNSGCQGDNNISLGFIAGKLSDPPTSSVHNVSIGSYAGGGENPHQLQATNSVFIGYKAESNPSPGDVCNDAVCIGSQANVGSTIGCIAIGRQAVSTGTTSMAVGTTARSYGTNNVSLGNFAGSQSSTVGQDNICIGSTSGRVMSGPGARFNLIIGNTACGAGGTLSTSENIFIGTRANQFGATGGGNITLAVSGDANDASVNLGCNYEAITNNSVGIRAGSINGNRCISILNNQDNLSTHNNCILLGNAQSDNADQLILNNSSTTITPATTAPGMFVGQMRGVALGLGVGVMKYDTLTKEVVYSTT